MPGFAGGLEDFAVCHFWFGLPGLVAPEMKVKKNATTHASKPRTAKPGRFSGRNWYSSMGKMPGTAGRGFGFKKHVHKIPLLAPRQAIRANKVSVFCGFKNYAERINIGDEKSDTVRCQFLPDVWQGVFHRQCECSRFQRSKITLPSVSIENEYSSFSESYTS